ncbi:MAG: shikimate dehydrogenase [Caldilineales bacterium]|nr:shikimate dehydrogenase [Caldilineales bacterium]MCW5859600.1 shikimate dehydrogenase [Caldilineales bacterium]
MLLTGLIGWPVGHSRSPAMHNAAFAAAGIEGVYLRLPVPPDRVGEAVRGLRALGFRGANVTIPHKQAVLPFLDELSPAASGIGAVNTITVREDGSLYGDNTDAPGFLADLAELGIRAEELRVGGALVMGAGGSARAIAYALASESIPVYVVARRPEQAQSLVEDLRPLYPGLALSPASPSSPPEARLIVNCTPAGMTPHEDASPWPDVLPFRPGQIVYDLVYNPPLTRLMQQARNQGLVAANGLGMLLHQGALAWEQWTGRPAPLEAMRLVISGQ